MVCIGHIEPHQVVSVAGGVRVGDRIVAINGQWLTETTQADMVQFLKARSVIVGPTLVMVKRFDPLILIAVLLAQQLGPLYLHTRKVVTGVLKVASYTSVE